MKRLRVKVSALLFIKQF